MEPGYEIENIKTSFSIRGDKWEIVKEKNIQRFKEDYPESTLPEHLMDNFNIARALAVMAYHLERLIHLNENKDI